MTTHVYYNDLPDGLQLGPVVAIDTETMGLNVNRDRLCLVQLTDGSGSVHMIRASNCLTFKSNLAKLLRDEDTVKIFHYARFDLGMLSKWLDIDRAKNVYCTKVASKLARTNTGRHGLASLCQDLLGVKLDKQQQTSDWGTEEPFTEEQLEYAAQDVLHLHALKDKLDGLIIREGVNELADSVFKTLPTVAEIDVYQYDPLSILGH